MAKSTNEHSGHRERMKKRFTDHGISNFQPHEALEMLLFYIIRRGNTNPIAHRLLNEFQTLDGVFHAPLSELMKIDGIGYESALYIKYIGEFLSYYHLSKNSIDRLIPGTETAKNFLVSLFADSVYEEFYVICLNSNYNIIRMEKTSSGSFDSAHIDTKRVMKFVLSNNTYSVILAHNHPSGTLKPSDNDIIITKIYERNFAMTDIKFIDHIIVAGNDCLSIRKHPMYITRSEII